MNGRALIALCLVSAAHAAPATFIDRATLAHREATTLVQAASARGDTAAAAKGRAALRSVDVAVAAYLKACPLLPGNGDPRPGCVLRSAESQLDAAVSSIRKPGAP